MALNYKPQFQMYGKNVDKGFYVALQIREVNYDYVARAYRIVFVCSCSTLDRISVLEEDIENGITNKEVGNCSYSNITLHWSVIPLDHYQNQTLRQLEKDAEEAASKVALATTVAWEKDGILFYNDSPVNYCAFCGEKQKIQLKKPQYKRQKKSEPAWQNFNPKFLSDLCSCGAVRVLKTEEEEIIDEDENPIHQYLNSFPSLSFKQQLFAKAYGVPMRRQRYSGYAGNRTASLIYDNNVKAYRLKFDWLGQEFVDLLKFTIPASHRTYDPKLKMWLLDIDENIFEAIEMILRAKFTSVIIKTKKEIEDEWSQFNNTTTPIKIEDELKTFVSMIRLAGLEVEDKPTNGEAATKLYRRAAMFLHPDRNPENAPNMSSLNASFQNLKEYFGLSK